MTVESSNDSVRIFAPRVPICNPFCPEDPLWGDGVFRLVGETGDQTTLLPQNQASSRRTASSSNRVLKKT